MSDPAAFKAAFADFKLIKTRGVAQLIFELPVEQADAALQTLGGLPRAASEVWAGICRLDPSKPASEPRKGNGEAVKERRKFSTMPLSQQAALRCEDENFRAFLAQRYSYEYIPDGLAAANIVRAVCQVKSRSEIHEGDSTGDRWLALDGAYQDWRHDVPLAGPAR